MSKLTENQSTAILRAAAPLAPTERDAFIRRCDSYAEKKRSRTCSHAPSTPGNSDPAVIPMTLSSCMTALRSEAGRSITRRYCLPTSFSLFARYASMSSIFVTLDT